MGNGSQVLLLTLKNLKIKGRNGCGTAVEAIFPLLCLVFLISIFVVSTSGADNDPIFSPVPIPTGESTKAIAYGPNIDLVRKLMLPVVNGQEDLLYPIDTSDEMEQTLIKSSATLNLAAGVFFRLTDEDIAAGVLPDDVTYAIRFLGKEIPSPLKTIEYTANANTSPNLRYLSFVALQQKIDQSIMALKLSEKTGVSSSVSMSAFATRFPVQQDEPNFDTRWQERNFILKPLGGTWLTFGILFSVYRLVNTVLIEKKTKVRDSMRMMGMRNEFYWLTWLVVSLVIILPALLICSILLKFLFFFPLTPIGIIFITWFLYAATLIAFAMIFSSFLNSAKSSGILTMLTVIIFSIAGELVAIAPVIPGVKILLSLFSPFAFNNIINILAEAENLRITMDYEHSTVSIAEYLPSLYSMIAMLVCDIVLYLLIAWYIDNVKTSGSKNRGCFCFRGSYWGKQRSVATNEESLEDYVPTEGDFENVDELGNPVVKIKRLRKTFDINGKSFIAVDGFKLDLYENQIVSLLGHNGAGKTTLISMLTGSLAPSSGDAEFYGNSLTKDLSALKKIVGICPQYDAIWPQLTVYEHLQLFAGFKGVKFGEIKAEADQLIKDFELEDKRDYPAGKLSGGQKRKLSIAIALIGGSKVVFLDEPSSGMDPEARRTVWDNLTRYKADRVIILTTHFMDEADYLGDRIAIMRHGKLLCAGSSLFLKNRFGLGYTLGCVKAPSCEVESVSEFLNELSPNIQMLSNAGAEVIFRVPRESFEDLPQLLTAIESNKNSLGITSYGVGQSTLEEVFLELNNDSTQDQGLDINLKDTVFIPGSKHPSKRRQLNALIRKRLRFAQRDGKFLFIQFAVPIILCLVAFIVQTFVFSPNNAVDANIAFDGKTYDTYLSSWSAAGCSTNFFTALPFYTSERFPEIAQSELSSFLGNINTFAAGAVVNSQCSSSSSNTYHLEYSLLYNASIPHSLPYHQNLISNALLNTLLGNSGRVTITTINQPAGAGIDLVNNLINIIIYLLILLGSSVLTASAAAYIFQERELGVKQLQLASGTNSKIYWLSNFIWDFVLHMIVFIIIFIIANAVSWSTFGGVRIGAELILIMLYSLSSVSIAYFFSFVFSGPGSGIGSLLGLFIGVGFGFLAMINAISAVAADATDVVSALGYIFKAISPHYLLLSSLGQLSNSFGSNPLNPVDENTNVFGINFWGASYVIFAGQFLIYGGFTLLFEEYTQLRLKRTTNANNAPRDADEDDDVAKERDAVDSANATDRESNLVWVRGLRKEFNAKKKIHKVAVHNFSLHIPRGESFGLLGANGAGKTTTLKMLSGQLLPSRGEVSINGNTYQQLNGILQSIGFCPQFDSVIPKLSGRAHLELFAELRGLPSDKVPSIVDALIKMINLTKYADRPCGKYSGGNKRKLSLALALIGNPPVLYLDEPSTGMDPLARRFMWNLIMAVRSNKAVILTTHSMEECEALCTRVGIMISGKLQCVGSPQHLKTKFGNGYRLELKTDMKHIDDIPKLISQLSKDAKLVDNHTTMFSYEIPMHNLTLGELLERVESVKHKYAISDYSVSQTSLEQIFITMAQECSQPKIVIEK